MPRYMSRPECGQRQRCSRYTYTKKASYACLEGLEHTVVVCVACAGLPSRLWSMYCKKPCSLTVRRIIVDCDVIATWGLSMQAWSMEDKGLFTSDSTTVCAFNADPAVSGLKQSIQSFGIPASQSGILSGPFSIGTGGPPSKDFISNAEKVRHVDTCETTAWSICREAMLSGTSAASVSAKAATQS